MYMHTPKERKEVIKTKTNTFSPVSDANVTEFVFFNAELKIPFQPIPF